MTKQEYIERYGLEAYEQYKIQNNTNCKERYQNDPEFRETRKARNKEYQNNPEYRESRNARNRERYLNDPEFRESRKAYEKAYYHNNSEYRESKKAYEKTRCHDDPEYREYKRIARKLRYYRNNQKKVVKGGHVELIENYELAKHDNFEGWLIHHKLGIGKDYRNSREDLKLMNLYYNRPPEELIWLTSQEHINIHNKHYNLLRSLRKK